MKFIRILAASFLLLLCTTAVRGQFYTCGTDPGGLKWFRIETDTYRIIYPEGLDSLARVYASNLENCADAVGWSIGFRPNVSYRKKMPVVLHPYSVSSNGVVTWAPRRMELITTPEAYSPDALKWETELAVHESRHVAQMQMGNSHEYGLLRFIAGEGAAGALPGICGGKAFLEGDAVAAETALTDAGRGRSADFLEYMRVCFAEGDYRNYWKWRYGSQKYHTPDFYRAGYLKMAGLRTEFNLPTLPGDYYRRLFDHHGVTVANFGKNLKESAGVDFKTAFNQVCRSLDSTWRADAALRGPFMPSWQVSADTRRYSKYEGLEVCGSSLFAVRRGLTRTPAIVRIGADGREKRVADVAWESSRLQFNESDSCFYWSEYRPDKRWEQASYSDVRRMSPDGKVKFLTRNGRYFNPSPKGPVVAVSVYPVSGGSSVVLLDAASGRELSVMKAPDGIQVTETVWLGDEIYAAAISDGGFGLYRVGDFECVLDPQPLKINHLGSHEGRLTFVSDFNGVNELYSFDPVSGNVRRISATPQGATDFRFSADTLYYTMPEPDGYKIFRTPADSIREAEVDFGSGRYRYAMEDRLSGMEKVKIPGYSDVHISSPEIYSRFGHLMKFHTWAPLFVDFDSIGDISLETVHQSADLGATAFFQNELSTASGSAAVRVNHKDWRPSGHLKFNYYGFYPVIETSIDFNGRESAVVRHIYHDKEYESRKEPGGIPFLSASVKGYIPFNFSSGGWRRGLVPQVNLGLSNDIVVYDGDNGEYRDAFAGRLSASVRAFVMKSVPDACIFPRLGIGTELGYSFRPGLADVIRPNAFAYAYGYLPGLLDTHGIRLSAMFQCHTNSSLLSEPYASIYPRGFDDSLARLASTCPVNAKFTFDYALPFAPVDWSFLSPALYVRNFELTLHSDYAVYAVPANHESASFYSVGADLAARLAAVCGIPVPVRAGVSYNCCGGAVDFRHSFDLLLTVDF